MPLLLLLLVLLLLLMLLLLLLPAVLGDEIFSQKQTPAAEALNKPLPTRLHLSGDCNLCAALEEELGAMLQAPSPSTESDVEVAALTYMRE